MGTKTVQHQHYHHTAAEFLLVSGDHYYQLCSGGLIPGVVEAAISFQVKRNSSSSSSSLSSVVVTMDKAIEQRSLEAIKATMQKQEEVFKQQVRELHRLYSVQRMLMDDLRTHEIERLRPTTTYSTNMTTTNMLIPTTTNLLIPPPATTHHTNLGFNLEIPLLLNAPTSSSSQSKTSSAEASRAPKGLFDLECRSVQETTHPRQESHAGPSSRLIHGHEDCGVDLTLSIGGGGSSTSKKGSVTNETQIINRSLGCTSTSEALMTNARVEIGFGGGSTSSDNKDICSSSSNPTASVLDQDKKAHWPFHGLSLKRM